MDPTPCIVIHHGGNWKVIPQMAYVGGDISIYDNLPDDIDLSYVKNIVSVLGYDNVIKMHFLDPTKDMDTGLRILADQKSFDTLILFLVEYGVVHIFYEHECDELDTNFSFVSLLNGVQKMHQGTGEEQDKLEMSEREVPFFNDKGDDDEEGNDNDVKKGCDNDDEENSDNSYEEGYDNDDEEGTDNDDEEIVDAKNKIKQYKFGQREFDEELDQLKRLAYRNSLKISNESEVDYSSDLESPNESSDEDDCGYLTTPPSRNIIRCATTAQDDFYINQEFENAVEFRKAIINYCVKHGKDVQYSKNHRDKVGVKCKAAGCPWKIWASWGGNKRTFLVKTINGQHICGRGKVLKKITATWIAEYYHSKFKINPYLKLQEIVDTIWQERGIEVSIFTAHKARKKAQQCILGEYMEQYGLLQRYAMEILKSNPENTVKFDLVNNIFRRIYISLSALRKGFLYGCRPFISIDGCFLKGPYGGQLLVAVGRDGNNQMYPIAWCVVEAENYESWKWFLTLLADDLETTYGSGYTIMSDQQKGLIKAVTEVWAEAEQRCCARHVYCNFRDVFGGGQEYRRAFWKVAKSTTENDFLERIKDFSDISVGMAENLLNRNYTKWCRAFFTPQSQCDNVDNNMSEVFNAYILKSRHKPIITMLEDIRESLMERMHKKRDFIANKNLSICPRIQKKLEESKFNARGWYAFWDGKFCFGVREGATQTKYVVNLSNKTCTCNVWQISGVPCNHGVAAIWKKGHHPEDYVADCYRRAAYLKAYEHCLEPLNGPQEWPQASSEPILPPPLKKLRACRPTTKRRKQAMEGHNNQGMRKTGFRIRCSKCGGEGHNKRKCTAADEPDITLVASTATVSEQVTLSRVASVASFKTATSNTPTKLATKSAKKKKRKQVTQEHIVKKQAVASTKQSQTRMHNKGMGIYTYPNGYQRIATMMPSMSPGVAVYSDYEGEQTIQSVSTLRESSCHIRPQTATTSNVFPWFIDANGKHRMTRQTLLDFAEKKRFRNNGDDVQG